MSALVTTTAPEIVVEQRVVLRNVSWETYERLMREHADRGAPRFTYNKGNLEIYMPTQIHEEISRFFEAFVSAVVEERDLDKRSLGSTTYRREDLDQGVEPDCCFYIQNVDAIEGLTKLDLAVDPPPDLIVEVDVTSPSVDKFSIYAALGAPEIWLYKKAAIKIFVLQNKKYVEAPESLALPKVTGDVLTEFLNRSQSEKYSTWIKRAREWARANPV